MPSHSRKRRLPLSEQMENDKIILKPSKKARAAKTLLGSDTEDSDHETLPTKISNKILASAEAQREEEQPENDLNTHPSEDLESEEEQIDIEMDSDVDCEIDAEDEAALSAFFGHHDIPSLDDSAPQQEEGRNLADMILQKISEHEASKNQEPTSLDPEVVDLFRGLGTFMKGYRSGKVPKSLKMLPVLKNWEEVLEISDPFSWTPNGVERLNRVMVSTMKAKTLQRFFENYLLPIVQEDIVENKKLNYHLYQALKKCVYKPVAFYKGLILPLLESGRVSNREAIIIGSILKKVSIPGVHSAVALLKMLQIEWHPPVSFFIRILLDKKYNLPASVISQVSQWFIGFSSTKISLPVVWHQSLLTFVERYKRDINVEDKDSLLRLIKAHHHPSFASLIRTELAAIDSKVVNQLSI
ncbi:hypothetical protein P9112_008867 [Eukaryota sp. TZLM1-RC]